MDSRMNDYGATSSLSRPTDARSSALATDGMGPGKAGNKDGLGSILECKLPRSTV